MVFTCCVKECNRNYPKTTRVPLFSFPKNEELKQKWINSIPRKNFVPKKYSKVCERHFKESDIRRESSGFDEKTGITITVSLKRPALCPGAIPTLFPPCTNSVSSRQKNLEAKKRKLEEGQLTTAIQQILNEGHLMDARRKQTKNSRGKKGSSYVIKKILLNVIKYCEKEAEKGEAFNPTEKASEMTGVAVHFLEEIHKEAREELNPISSNDTGGKKTKRMKKRPKAVHTSEPNLIKPSLTTLITSVSGPSIRKEPDSSMMEQDVHLAMTCEVYPADETHPDFLSKIKEEPRDPDKYKQGTFSCVTQELRHSLKEPSLTCNRDSSLFQPPAFIKEEPISSEDET